MEVESQSGPRPEWPSRSPAEAQEPADQPATTIQARTPTGGRAAPIWLGHGTVIRLRELGIVRVYYLPAAGIDECVVGSEPPAAIQLFDPGGFVSRKHARLVRVGAFWQIEDLGSKNGIREDGASRAKFPLVPGVEVGIGSLTLIAENQMMIDLGEYLARVLGWEANRSAVDGALRAIRAAAVKGTPLTIAGDDDQVAVARQIHLRTKLRAAPFVVCGPGPRESDLQLRVTATHDDAKAAFELAAGGTVCVRADDLPVGFDHLAKAARDPEALAQLIICANTGSKRTEAMAPAIVVPPLTTRTLSEMQRIVSEYAVDAIAELGAAPTSFTEADRDRVTSQEATSFADIEIATLRLVALKDAGNTHRAAARLGMSHVSLGSWFKRRGITS